MKIWKIKLTDTSDVTAFAAKEFERLIKKADAEARVVLSDDGELEIGLRADFTHPAVKDAGGRKVAGIPAPPHRVYPFGYNPAASC